LVGTNLFTKVAPFVNQICDLLNFAGDGKLRDDNSTSIEFRDFLSQILSIDLKQYLGECISEKFEDNGFVLQDIVNQIGSRLGFSISYGRYRGVPGKTGYDGLWKFPDGHTVVVEVKTTDAYQINLETIAKYRREIVAQGLAADDNSSILIVLGGAEKDTSNLEAQIRGSRFAWNIRLISVDALVRLMFLKEEVDDPQIIQRISAVLIPREFTKLDEIIDLVFFTAVDVKEGEELESNDVDSGVGEKIKPAVFHEACVKRLEEKLNRSFVKRSRTAYSTSNQDVSFSCAVSKKYNKGGRDLYWFAFHLHQKQFLEQAKESYVSFGCGAETKLLMIPFKVFAGWLDSLHTTEENRIYWHIKIEEEDGKFVLLTKTGFSRIPLDKYLL
jgi:hypothetical protein